MYDAIVIGGGIVGASTAYHLARDGAATLLIDRGDAGRATDAGAGIVSPETSVDPSDFALAAAAYYPELVAELEATADVDAGYDRPGRLVVAAEADERRAFETTRDAVLDRQWRAGDTEAIYELSPEDAAERFPPLGEVEGALYYEDAGRVDGRRMERALRRAGAPHGLETLAADAERIATEGGTVAGVVVDGERYDAGAVVVAGGAWSPAFADQLDTPLPVEPQRGQIVHLDLQGTDTAGWPIVSAFRDHYLVPWPDSRVAAGATRETGAGIGPHTTVEGLQEVFAEAVRVAPGLRDASVEDIRAGLRPLSRDGRPIVGETAIEGAYVATGHGPVGLTLGPYTGNCLADLIRGNEVGADLGPFSPARFSDR